jgi:hypothetical protein
MDAPLKLEHQKSAPREVCGFLGRIRFDRLVQSCVDVEHLLVGEGERTDYGGSAKGGRLLMIHKALFQFK